MKISRRDMLIGSSAVALSGSVIPISAQQTPMLRFGTRVIEVNNKPATVFSVLGADGKQGLVAQEGDRFAGDISNQTGGDLVMHWHGQVLAAAGQDRSRPNGGVLPTGQRESVSFALTPGTHWMHSHQLTEQQLLAAPMIAVEKNSVDEQQIIMMLHDFSFRTPEEILAGLAGLGMDGAAAGQAHVGASAQNGGAFSLAPGNGHTMPMGMMQHTPRMGSGMPANGMQVHANDVLYDAFLANDRSLTDPEIVRVDRGHEVRLRIINGGTATAFFIDTGLLEAHLVSVDGTPCSPFRARRFPIAQGQRMDLKLTIPASGGAFPIFAQVEADRRRTGIILATMGAEVKRVDSIAPELTPHTSLALDEKIRALNPLPAKNVDRAFYLMLGEESGYAWTINGKRHGEHEVLSVSKGARVEITFMNPTAMMHPMHLHGHHFQVVSTRAGRFAGPVRDTVIVPPHSPVTVAFDAINEGEWFIHCHHLYHMAAGMMTEIKITA